MADNSDSWDEEEGSSASLSETDILDPGHITAQAHSGASAGGNAHASHLEEDGEADSDADSPRTSHPDDGSDEPVSSEEQDDDSDGELDDVASSSTAVGDGMHCLGDDHTVQKVYKCESCPGQLCVVCAVNCHLVRARSLSFVC